MDVVHAEGTEKDLIFHGFKWDCNSLIVTVPFFFFFLKNPYYGLVRADSRLFKPQKSKYPMIME